MGEPQKTQPILKLGIRYKERKNNPPPGLTWRRFEKGENLAAIAAEYDIRPVDLALYNWHTVKEDEINWYLYHYVGCRKYEGKWYVFSLKPDKNHGWILVPDYPPSIKKGPPKSVDAVRNGSATLDTKLQVYPVEWLATGGVKDISGKWLYVFSGQSGVNFGYNPPPPPPKKDAAPLDQPGTAFTLDFPGYFHLKEKPDKLEYEILVTSAGAPDTDLLVAAAGKQDVTKPHYQYGNKWFVLSDPAILKKATSENRDKRTTHALRNSKTVTIDLSQNRRFYFLLSPVQLGPEAIKYAMNNPAGLVPLLRSHVDGSNWDPKDPDQNVGPTVADIKKNPITLRVYDPYAWAEDIAEKVYQDSLKAYVEWITSKKNETIKELHEQTKWPTLDHLLVAQILRSVRNNYPKPGKIDDELKDADLWKKNLEIWEKGLIQRNAELNANAHRSLIELIEWLEHAAHKIVETAVLKDTSADNAQDAIDIGWGILHWAVCTEHMFGLEPGVVYLREIVNRPGTVPFDKVLTYFQNLDKDTYSFNVPKLDVKGMRYGFQGVLRLQALADFVSPFPAGLVRTGTQQDFLTNLAEYNQKKRDNLIKFFNTLKILPVELKAPKDLPGMPGSKFNWSVASTAVNGALDVMDKWTTYVIDPDINIRDHAGKSRILNRLAKMEEWFQKRPTLAKVANQGTSYGLKVAATVIGIKNLYTALTTSRYDYQKDQMTVSGVDWANTISGVTLAVQDVLAEIAVLSRRQGLQRIFPSLMVSSGGPSWGVGAARVTGIVGSTFAAVNVLAMAVAGITTIISMQKSARSAASRGDYTAAKFYYVGVIGGVMMTTGAVVFGYALLQAGGIASATGIGATVGVVLFFIGGVLAAIGTIFGSLFSSDDYQVFARKCFLGEDGEMEPRFSFASPSGGTINAEPPDWSHAAQTGSNTWPIEKQKRAIINLLGQFKLKTKPDKFDATKQSFLGTVNYEITPGLFRPGSTIEIALHYGKGAQTSFTAEWVPEDKNDYRLVKVAKGGIFDAEKSRIYFNSSDGQTVKNIKVWVDNLNYDLKKGALLTTVTMGYPDNKDNVIRCRKLVIGPNIQVNPVQGAIDYLKDKKIKADDNEETSALFE